MKIIYKIISSKEVIKIVNILSFVLITSYITSLFAPLNWACDLFRHFMHQYFLGSLALAPILIYMKKPLLSMAIIIVFCLSAYEIYSTTEVITHNNKHNGNTLKIVHYNRHYNLQNHENMIKWIEEQNPDIFIVQETGETHSVAIKGLLNTYPHQVHKSDKGAFGFVLASKHKIISSRIHQDKKYVLNNIYVHARIKLPDGNIISVYASHPPPPVSYALQKQRNENLKAIASEINNDDDKSIIFMGDWNITQYSPYFKDLLDSTGLQNQHTSPYPQPTWPSTFITSILQIPIDHILHKGDLTLINKNRSHHLGSDHYPIIAEFSLNKPSNNI